MADTLIITFTPEMEERLRYLVKSLSAYTDELALKLARERALKERPTSLVWHVGKPTEE